MKRPLYAYTMIDAPFDEVASVLTENPTAMLGAALGGNGQEALAHLDIDVAGREVGRSILVHVGTPEPRGAHELVLPLRWSATEHAGLYPAAHAHLELTALSSHPPVTQVTLVGSYEPPMGLVGGAADRVVGEHVVERSVERLLDRIVARLCAGLERHRALAAITD